MDEQYLRAISQLRQFLASEPADPMRSIRGRFGPMTEASQRGRVNDDTLQAAPDDAFMHPIARAALNYGPVPAQIATSIATQPYRAGIAVGDAISNPTLPNVTDAAMQTGMALFQPAKAAGALAAGYGIAGLKDAGAFDLGAVAQSKSKQVHSASSVSGMSRDELAAISKQTGTSIEVLATMPRGRINALVLETAKGTSNAAISEEIDRKRREAIEFDQQVATANAALAAEKAKRPKRFDETAVGALYNKTGIATPGLLALGAGGITRLATGGGSVGKEWIAPGAVGALTGVSSAHWPLGHGVLFEPAANPEKTEYAAYARELPPTHPRKAEWTNYAGGQKDDNPARKPITEEFYDPMKFLERTGIGLVEGVGGGLTGGHVVPAIKNAAIGSYGLPGAMRERAAIANGRADVTKRYASETIRADRELSDLADQLRRAARQETSSGSAQAIDAHPVQGAVASPAEMVHPNQLLSLSPAGVSSGNQALLNTPVGGAQNALVHAQRQAAQTPYPLNVEEYLTGTKQGAAWAKNSSDAAREKLLDLVGGGKDLMQKRGKMGDPKSISSTDFAAIAPHSTARKQLDMLRDVLVHRGYDLRNITRAQVEEALKSIDPRIFAAPAMAVGAGGVGANALMQDY